MENSFYYNTSSINFIKILFRIFLVFFVVSVILIFSLNVNDTVEFREGLIYSNTPQLKINAPNEVKILKVFVKEGQEVQKGDTIFILENKRTQSDFDIANMDVEGMTNKIVIVKGLIKNAQERKNAINQLLEIQSKIYTTDRKKAEQEIATINNKINLSSEQSSIMSDKYKVDSLLYAKGAISRYELSETKNKNIEQSLQHTFQPYHSHVESDNSHQFQCRRHIHLLVLLIAPRQISESLWFPPHHRV